MEALPGTVVSVARGAIVEGAISSGRRSSWSSGRGDMRVAMPGKAPTHGGREKLKFPPILVSPEEVGPVSGGRSVV